VNPPGAPEPLRRRPYLDWLRGIAVLIMIEAHTLDSWTRAADRQSSWYQLAVLIAGYGAPIFLFLAGITLMLAAGGRLRKGLNLSATTRAVLRRGTWILALAFLFRLQSFLISGGRFPQALLKVDILNVMGVSMLAAALGWGAASTPWKRAALFAATTIAVAMTTPLIRSWPLLSVLPDSLEAYLRPRPGLTNFTLFPWAGFFSAGCVVGACLDASRAVEDRRLMGWVALAGLALAVGGYGASFLPPIYAETSFWTSSPTFFFLRLGVLLVLLAGAYGLSRAWQWQPLQDFGRASLFVYWVHVELVYGVLSAPIHRRLPLPVAAAAFVAFTAAMFGLVRLKDAVQRRRGRSTESRLRPKPPSVSAERSIPRNSI
jgi:uncharacterized membrane protein